MPVEKVQGAKMWLTGKKLIYIQIRSQRANKEIYYMYAANDLNNY